MTASPSPETDGLETDGLEAYLDRSAADDPQTGQTKDDEEERVRRDSIRPGKPVFDMVARLVAANDTRALELLYSGSTPLHAIIADGVDFREDEGFAARTGAPFDRDEHAGVHALRALGGLGLALVAPESAERTLPSALAWYTEARSAVAAPGWDPRGIAKADPRLRPLAELLARAPGDERWAAGALTAAVTLRALASPAREPGRWRKAIDRLARTARPGVTVLLAARTGEDREGVRARLEMSVEAGLPPGLVADPGHMALFTGDQAFRQSLDRAWAQTGAKQARGTVLWSIVATEGSVPDIEGESAGAALAVVLNEVRRLSRRLAEALVIRRIKGDNAVIGRIDDRGYLQSVEGYVSKLNALDNGAKVIVPAVDFEKADEAAKHEKHLHVVPVADWKEAAKKARGANRTVVLRQSLAFVLVAALGLGVFGLLQAGNAAAQQRFAIAQQRLAAAQKRVSLSARLTSTADSLRGSDPGLAAQFDAAAYRANPTPVADTDLLNDESSPLDTYLPAGTGTSANQPDSALVVSPAGNAVAVVSDFTVRLYDAADPARPPAALGSPVSTGVPAWPLAFSPDGRVLAAVGAGDLISLWNATDPAAPSRLSTLSGGGITALAFAREGPVLAVGTKDGDVQLWNVTDPADPVPLGSLAGPAAHSSYDVLEPGGITSLMFASTNAGTLWAATSDGAIETWDTGDPARPRLTATPLSADVGNGVETSFSPAGEAVQTDSDGYSYADSLESYAFTSSYPSPVQVSTSDASPSVISPDGYTIATRDADGNITLVNRIAGIAGYPLGPPFPQNEVNSAGTPMNPLENSPGLMAFNATGTVLAVDDDGSGVYLWHLPSGYAIDSDLGDANAQLPAGFTMSEARMLGVGKSARPLDSLLGSEAVLAVSGDGTVLAALDAESRTILWNVASPSRPRQLGKPFADGAVAAALSADGAVFALLSEQDGTSDSLQFWSLTDPARPQRLGAPIAEPYEVTGYAMAISPDDQTLALGSPSGEVDLIPLKPQPGGRYGEPLASNYDNQSNLGSNERNYTGVDALAYSPDGTTLTAVNGDSTVRVWDLNPATAIAAVCTATGQPLTAAAWNKYGSSPPCPANGTGGGTAPPPVTAPSLQGAPAGICTAGDLALAIGPIEPRIATPTRQLVLTNVSHAACSVPGTPAVNLIGPSDADGSIFSLEPAAENQANQPNPKNPVTLLPGGQAHMDATFLGTQHTATHPGWIYNWVPQQLQIVLPGSHATLTVPWASRMSVLRQIVPREPANYYTPLMPGTAPSSAGPAASPPSATASAAGTTAAAPATPDAGITSPGLAASVAVNGSLSGSVATSAGNAWAVGSDGTGKTLILNWNGSAWKRQSSASPGSNGDDDTLAAVAATSSSDAWAVGSTQSLSGTKTLIEHWNGSAWKTVQSPSPTAFASFDGVTALSAGNAWAVGAAGGKTLIAHWNGATWTQVDPSISGALEAVAATSAGNAWAVGFAGSPGGAGILGNNSPLILHWNGAAWEQVSTSLGSGLGNLRGVAATSAGNAWAVGCTGCLAEGAGAPLIERWNGTGWASVPTPSQDALSGFNGVTATSSTNAWAVGIGSTTGIAHWDGHTWKLVPSPDPGGQVHVVGVAATSANNAWAVGETEATTPFMGVISHWNGSTWK